MSHFEEKNRSSRGSSNKNESIETSPTEGEKRESIDKDQDVRRKMIYGSESFKEKFEEDFPSSV